MPGIRLVAAELVEGEGSMVELELAAFEVAPGSNHRSHLPYVGVERLRVAADM